ncbi:hypothetical protein BD410DRAFT_750151, partial [Rickenella mellea]
MVRIPTQLAQTTRSYAISVQPPIEWEGKRLPRRFDERKTFLYNQYARLLASSSSSPILFLEHTNFRAQSLIKLRRDIAAASTQHVPTLSGNISTKDTPAKLSVITTSLFGVALRDYAPLDQKASKEIEKMVKGGLAVLTLPTLNPPQLQAIVRALERAVPPKVAQTPEELAKEASAEADAYVPGRRQKRIRKRYTPELTVLGAIIEGRVFSVQGVKDVAGLPTLETLHAQIVGLLSSPATQLAAVLSEASGGRLARTLEGFKKGLEG